MYRIGVLFFLKFTLLFATGGCFAAHSRMPVQTENGSKREKTYTVVAFGNSITATRSTVQRVFAQRLPELLAVRGITAEVINAGIPGSHTGSIRDHSLFKIRHAKDRFESDVLAHHPDLVTIGFGTNDAYIDGSDPNGPSRIPLSDYEKNLTFMIKTLQECRVKVVLIAPNMLGGKFPGYQNERLMQYVATVRRLSREYQTGLVDNVELFMKYHKDTGYPLEALLLDGIHPNDLGHQLMAEKMVEEVQRLLILI
ncbi:SGNH/GDSL hydrolase family protein [Cyclobacterium xiamenense]|uniref:SGNH/GDSL hydrolase family protein n=1 Tax=Cyclobacterium xiamenense TaxID=1297121 RepID=UPI0012B8AEC2|nr:GDSL-type esterase/lipase family protein [Cyclobacterium xiamenense]